MSEPVLYLFVGYPGAGKTTAAKIIAEHTGAYHIWADHERRKRVGTPTHSQAESDALYAELNGQAAQLLISGESVIFDTNFNYRADRDKLRGIAAAAGGHTKLIWITTPVNVARARAVDSEARNGYEVPMTTQQFDAIASKLEAPTDDEAPIKIEGDKLTKQTLIEALA